MKTKLLHYILIFCAVFGYSQVGINNSDPKTTLDVSAKRDVLGAITDNTQKYGLQAPRLTRGEMTALTSTYGNDQKGALVYITDVTGGNTNSPRTNMDIEGYYYFDGSLWQKLSSSALGDTTNDAWVNDATNTMVKLGTKSDGSARDAGTDFVARDNGAVGIGTASPNASALLDVSSTTKGFLPPRMTNVQKTAIASPVSGLVVYCTDCNSCNNAGGELVVYTGTGAGQGWKCVGGGGGTAVFTSDCSTAVMNGTLSVGNPATSNITMNVNVTSLGTYNIQSSVTDGVQFIANGSFTATGIQTLTLYPTGTPASAGSFTWTINSGGSSCSVTSTVNQSSSLRVIKVLSLSGGYDLGTVGGGWFNNLVNNNNEFGPSGTVKFNSVQFTTLAYNTITAGNLADTFSKYDIVFFSAVGAANSDTWNDATENAFVSYLGTKRSVVIMEGANSGGTGSTADFATILGKLNVVATNTLSNGYMYWDSPLTSFQSSPINGTFGNVTGLGYSVQNGQAWQITTSRTDLAFLKSSGNTPNINVGFWSPNQYLFYTGDDDGLGSNSIVCGLSNPKSSTNCTYSPYTIRGARWFANLVAFAVNNLTPKGYVTDN